jgi:hypothetical protein
MYDKSNVLSGLTSSSSSAELLIDALSDMTITSELIESLILMTGKIVQYISLPSRQLGYDFFCQPYVYGTFLRITSRNIVKSYFYVVGCFSPTIGYIKLVGLLIGRSLNYLSNHVSYGKISYLFSEKWACE